jgi:hypothetical protein
MALAWGRVVAGGNSADVSFVERDGRESGASVQMETGCINDISTLWRELLT